MSLRENIQIFHPVDVDRYLEVLKTEYSAQKHLQQKGAYLIDGLPFYAPQLAEGYIFIMGFNMVPLSHLLIRALAEHSELAPKRTMIRWTQEQDVIFKAILGKI